MEKIIFKDGTEFEIQEGGSLGHNTVVVPDFASLEAVAEALTKEGNLDEVNYKSGDQVIGKYTDMKLEAPLFTSVDYYTDDKQIAAVFAIREKTEIEKEIDIIKGQQNIQDGAIMELAGMIGGEA